MALCKVGSKKDGFNSNYNKFSECFQDSVVINEERRIGKLISPWIAKADESYKSKLKARFDASTMTPSLK